MTGNAFVEKIQAAITATEQAAHDASARGQDWSIAEPPENGWWRPPHDDEILAGGKPIIRVIEEYGGPLVAEHVVRHSPARVLRDCAADRRMLQLYHQQLAKAHENSLEEERAWAMEPLVRALADRYEVDL